MRKGTGTGTGGWAIAGAVALLMASGVAVADWPQWRGPGRDGIAPGKPVVETWGDDGPELLWESVQWPSGNDAGLGSVSASDGRAYVLVNWYTDRPIPTRTITDKTLRSLGWQKKLPPDDLLAKIEAERMAISPRLRGSSLQERVDQWIEANLTEEQRKQYKSFAERRLKATRDGMPLKTLEQLARIEGRTFESHEAFERWLDNAEIGALHRQEVLKEVDTVEKTADDVVLCLDIKTGRTIWEARFASEPAGARDAGTPCVVGDRVYVCGVTHAYCLSTAGGSVIWKTDIAGKVTASSFVHVDGLVIVNIGALTAFDAATGEVRWTQDAASTTQSSPMPWRHGDKTYVLVNTSGRELVCVDVADGRVAWTAPGGGVATPAVAGDVAVVHVKDTELGLIAYRMTAEGATRLWNHPLPGKGRGASSPIIHDGHVYLVGADRALCKRLADGHTAWEEPLKAQIASPVLVGDKLVALTNNGGYLMMFAATPAKYAELGKARVGAQWCPSPAYVDGRLLVRMKSHVACYGLGATSVTSAE